MPQRPLRGQRRSSRLFTIDVSAADARGRAVDNLSPADFELREGGARAPGRVGPRWSAPAPLPRRIRRRSSRAPPTNGSRPRADEARLFAIFLDEYHVTSGANTDRVRAALLQLRRSRPDAARPGRRDEAARFALRDSPDAGSRRRPQRHRDLRWTRRATTSRATPTSATTSPARRRGSTRPAARWRCRPSTRWPCTSAAWPIDARR